MRTRRFRMPKSSDAAPNGRCWPNLLPATSHGAWWVLQREAGSAPLRYLPVGFWAHKRISRWVLAGCVPIATGSRRELPCTLCATTEVQMRRLSCALVCSLVFGLADRGYAADEKK